MNDSENNYNKIGRFYNFLSGSFEGRYRTKAIEMISVQPGESILEIGFGPGHSLIDFADAAGETGRITGIDNSASMYRISQRKLKHSGLENRVDLTCADVLEVSFKEDSFDGIFMSFTLETFSPEKINLLMNKIKSWLKPGGKVCILCMAESEKKTLIYRLYLWSHRKFPVLVDCRPINPEKILTESGFSIRNKELLKTYNLPVKIVLAAIS